VVPVQARGKTLGTLIVCMSFPQHWEENEVGYLSIIASQGLSSVRYHGVKRARGPVR